MVPNDQLFYPHQWALHKLGNEADINCQEGWDAFNAQTNPGSEEVIVAVIDTGIDYNHPDLRNQMWVNPGEIPNNGKDDDGNGFVDDVHGVDLTSNNRGNPMDINNHGTHCAGVIAASTNNNRGIAGIAGVQKAKVKLMAIKSLAGTGQASGELSWLLGGVNYAIEMGAQISSNSWGGGSGGLNVLRAILNNAPEHLFIAAAGNLGKRLTASDMTCGANAPNQICVGSTTKNNRRSSFSNYGKPYVHVMAPGSDIVSTISNNRYAYDSGTSMACPHVSGLAALVKSMKSNLTPQQIKSLIESNVQVKSEYSNICTSSGLIDVYATIMAAKAFQPEKTCDGIERWIGDGWCDVENNNPQCNYDGGDCCPPYQKSNWNYYCKNNCQCLGA